MGSNDTYTFQPVPEPHTSDERWVFLWSQLAHNLTAQALGYGIVGTSRLGTIEDALRAERSCMRAREARARSVAAHKRMTTRLRACACGDLMRRLAGESETEHECTDSENYLLYIERAREIEGLP